MLFKRVICMQRNKCTGFSKDTVLSWKLMCDHSYKIYFISYNSIRPTPLKIYNWKTFACDLHYTLGTSKFVLLTWLSTATFYVSTKLCTPGKGCSKCLIVFYTVNSNYPKYLFFVGNKAWKCFGRYQKG